MKHRFFKQLICICSILVLLLGLCPAPTMAEGVSVEIVGFMSGNTTGLRSSELLQARVTGYSGNTADLTYKWTNALGSVTQSWFWNNYYGTYLYVFNDHNMYTVQGTVGEQEIYNTAHNVTASDNMAGRTQDKTFTGTGYAYAAVYGADLNARDYTTGSISVEVYDGDTLLGTASYSGFQAPDLGSDLDNAVFGVFAGDSIDVKDLLGESAILHVNCEACSVTEATITDNSNCITIGGNAPNYSVTGNTEGTAAIRITVKKENCKFHQYASYTATPTVHVFKKPTVTGGLTTLTLTDLDDDCTYYIGNAKGERSADGKTVVFEGLTPSTTYPIEVRGHYTDDGEEKIVYAYVSGTTLTPNVAAVQIRLDGELTTMEAVGLEGLYLQQAIDNVPTGDPIPLTYHPEGHNYTAQVADGIYHVHAADDVHIGDHHIVISGVDATTTLQYYTLTYDTAGGTLNDTAVKQIYLSRSAVHTTNELPKKPGYYFAGWSDGTNVYQPNTTLVNEIISPLTLTALWEDAVDVYVHFSINHIAADGNGHNNDKSKHNVTFTVDSRETGSVGDYTELAHRTITWDGKSAFDTDGYTVSYAPSDEADVTYYNATAPTFSDLPKGLSYTVTTAKSGYDVVGITSTTDADGNVTLEVELIYDPGNFDLTFNVLLDEEAKTLPAALRPTHVNLKVTSWGDTPYDDDETVEWETITQHHETYLQLTLDENGQAVGTFPVWMNNTDDHLPYHYRLEIISYEMPDRSVLPAADRNFEHTHYLTADERISAEIIVDGGADPDTADTDPLTGVYFANGAQQGTLTALISIRKPDLTLDAAGGTIGENTTALIPEIITVPDLTPYTPTRDGYVFMGWFDEAGNAVTAGMSLSKNTTAYARWAEALTINGTVTVENFYELNGVKTLLNTADRITHTTALLRRRPIGIGNYITIAEQTVSLDPSADTSVNTFAFTHLPATDTDGDGYEYIVALRQSNYNVDYTPSYTYTAVAADGSSDTRQAAKPEFIGNTAEVAALLHFDPVNVALPFTVDTTRITAQSVRPIAVTLAYEAAAADNNGLDWYVITQHNGDNEPISATVTDGFATGNYPVWSTTPDGVYEYLYRLKVIDYTMPDGTVIPMTDNVLFNVYIGEPVSTNTENAMLTAAFSPLPFELTLNTLTTDTHIEDAGYTFTQDTHDIYLHQFFYGTGVPTLPIPQKEGYSFEGWYDSEGNRVTTVAPETKTDVTLYAKWEAGYNVNFHANHPLAESDILRSYYEPDVTLPEGDRYFSLTDEGTVGAPFYDLPTLSDSRRYIFKGWYLDHDNENDSRPLDWSTVFTGETHIYAHWLYVDDVAHETEDKKIIDGEGYLGFELAGVQIRRLEKDNQEHYGEAGSGLRFVSVLSKQVADGITAIHPANADYEYGLVLAKTATAQKYAAAAGIADKDYLLQYKSENVNGVNTATAFKFVQNLKLSGVPDHYEGTAYRLFTGVVTFKNKEGDELIAAHNTAFSARPYLRCYDANGLYRTHYLSYGGTLTYGGCSASYAGVAATLEK